MKKTLSVLLIAALLTAIYLLTTVARAWFPVGGGTIDNSGVCEAGWRMTLPMGILAAGIVLTGVLATPIVRAVQAIAGFG